MRRLGSLPGVYCVEDKPIMSSKLNEIEQG